MQKKTKRKLIELITFITVAAALMTGGCKEVEAKEETIATPEITLTFTPKPTPTVTPEASPILEPTPNKEEEKELLGLSIDEKEVTRFYNHCVFYFQTENGQIKMAFCKSFVYHKLNEVQHVSSFKEEDILFSMKESDMGLSGSLSDLLKYDIIPNEDLGNINIIKISDIPLMRRDMKELGIEEPSNEEFQKIMKLINSTGNPACYYLEITMGELVDFYLSFPEEYRVYDLGCNLNNNNVIISPYPEILDEEAILPANTRKIYKNSDKLN